MRISTIGLDLAKSVFQVHGVDSAGNVVVAKRLRRGEVLRFFAGLSPCLVGMEACASAHYWAPELARVGLRRLAGHLRDVEGRIKSVEREILAWCRSNAVSRRLATIPGVGELSASALAATVSDPSQFRSGRDLAAWLGLTPRQHSSGGKTRLGRISKQGDRYVRCLLVLGATSLLGHSRLRGRIGGDWFEALRARRPGRVATVALANKMARIAWAVLARGETFQARAQRLDPCAAG